MGRYSPPSPEAAAAGAAFGQKMPITPHTADCPTLAAVLPIPKTMLMVCVGSVGTLALAIIGRVVSHWPPEETGAGPSVHSLPLPAMAAFGSITRAVAVEAA
ncbi:Uncharacterised protein [Mycobacteroides abscessus subsp. abscessus]|nr:Uncharacterised protein [Mycobacteroides abscessus subsp. abscessus]